MLLKTSAWSCADNPLVFNTARAATSATACAANTLLTAVKAAEASDAADTVAVTDTDEIDATGGEMDLLSGSNGETDLRIGATAGTGGSATAPALPSSAAIRLSASAAPAATTSVSSTVDAGAGIGAEVGAEAGGDNDLAFAASSHCLDKGKCGDGEGERRKASTV